VALGLQAWNTLSFGEGTGSHSPSADKEPIACSLRCTGNAASQQSIGRAIQHHGLLLLSFADEMDKAGRIIAPSEAAGKRWDSLTYSVTEKQLLFHLIMLLSWVFSPN
jgi:hypothetical protein